MNDLILQERVLKNKSVFQHVEMVVFTIIFAVSPLLLYYHNRVMAVLMGGEGSPVAQVITAFYIFTFVTSLYWSPRFIFLKIKMVLPVQVTQQGVRIPRSSKVSQLIRWDEIEKITKGNTQNSGPISFGVRAVWKVETLLRPQFSLNKDARYSFYITSNHENHKELLALLKEKTSLKIEAPTRKPKIPPWQPGNAR